ncbi:hypothetical protein HOP50_06g45610 [Chloropicon primus]|uniref:Uncharacterized protein n=1 Tax=Chloropicon primus TaxID=1764295 RepID=A0A5B8MRI5_9CHLO|nr:hypothetical protein A3770_06p45380 [Chloropicon primus]UPR01240.1 hypothetical protein HOP50_06g45610 [Chloropicon primus]|eukprot:QDZ22020.1 hypothetical protein A3770_06p45380 [Chloropicon primus]
MVEGRISSCWAVLAVGMVLAACAPAVEGRRGLQQNFVRATPGHSTAVDFTHFPTQAPESYGKLVGRDAEKFAARLPGDVLLHQGERIAERKGVDFLRHRIG